MVGRKKRAKCTPRSATDAPRRPHPGSDRPGAASSPPRAAAGERERADVTRVRKGSGALARIPLGERGGRPTGPPVIARETTPVRGPAASTLWSLGHGGRLPLAATLLRETAGPRPSDTTKGRRGDFAPPARSRRATPVSGTLGDRRNSPAVSHAGRAPLAVYGAYIRNAYIRNWMPARTGNAHQVSSIWSASSSSRSSPTSKSSELRKIARVSAPRKSPTCSVAW